jgi:hypothetical protein
MYRRAAENVLRRMSCGGCALIDEKSMKIEATVKMHARGKAVEGRPDRARRAKNMMNMRAAYS